jgi:hypothetical protein
VLKEKGQIEVTDLDDMPLVTMRSDMEPRFGKDLNRIFGVARIRPRIFHQATTQAEALELVSENGIAALTMPSAQYPSREGIVFRRFVDEFLTAETGLAYIGENESAILSSLRSLLVKIFQPFASSGAGGQSDGRTRQMSLF